MEQVRITGIAVSGEWFNTLLACEGEKGIVAHKVGRTLGYRIEPEDNLVHTLHIGNEDIPYSKANPIIVGEQTLRTLWRHGSLSFTPGYGIVSMHEDTCSMEYAMKMLGKQNVLKSVESQTGATEEQIKKQIDRNKFSACTCIPIGRRYAIVGNLAGKDGTKDVYKINAKIYGYTNPQSVKVVKV